jgi:hypothetical protein
MTTNRRQRANTNDTMEEVSCRGKRRYLTITHAAYDAHTIHERTGDNVQAYHCSLCHAWHVGTSDTDSIVRLAQKKQLARRRAADDRRLARRQWDDDE